MRAIQAATYGDSSVLSLNDAPVPEPGDDEALVKLEYAGINFIDVYMREGRYKESRTYINSPPFTIGMEGSGTIAKTGPGVSHIKEGDRVAYCLSLGSYAEYAAVPAWRLVKVPDDVDLQIGAALMLQGCTAHYLSHSLFPLEEGHTCLIHAAAGGVGQTLVQLAKLRGAYVIATAGTDEKAEIARACGADFAINYNETDFAQVVEDITDGRKADVVYDSVGAATYERSMKCLKKRGTLALFGAASGRVPPIDPIELAESGSIFLTRPHQADYMQNFSEINNRAQDLFGHIAAGRLKAVIDTVFPIQDAKTAHDTIEGRLTKGKLLLEI
ncbi:MAG: quinone oxidoreductase [Rhodospirillaceae bacterium]|jgi:NADPH2:quinone reductase